MNKILMLIFAAVVMACSDVEDAAPVVPVDDDFDTSTAVLVRQGDILGIGHTASGVASIYEVDNVYRVVLDPYSSQNGPDLKIYLSKDADASEYIRLGNLKSIIGKQTYDIPPGTDVSQYNYVHVWCEKFTVVFARAEVK